MWVRRKPNPSWICITLVICLMGLPSIFSKCHGVNIGVTTYPPGVISVLYGESLQILCVAENYTSEDIEFALAENVLPSTVVNSTTRLLYIEKAEKQASTYYCYNKKTKKTCTNRVQVDSLPENVADFKCISKNLEVLNCTWTSPDSYTLVNYRLSYLINGHFAKECAPKRIHNIRYCAWNAMSQPRYKQYEEEFYFNLKACNVFGCNDQNITVDHFGIVKPDPPANLKIVSNGTHSVVIYWSLPNNIVDFLTCGVEHKIEYQIANNSTAKFVSVDATLLPPRNKTYRFLLNLPYARTLYTVKIQIKSKNAVSDEFWSDMSYILFYTASDKPSRPPDTMIGGFDQIVYETNRSINVYWKQLEVYEEGGANFTYKVVISQAGKTQTLHPDVNKSLSYVTLEDASLEALQVSVWSLNSFRSSANSSDLYIPPERDTRSLAVNSFTKSGYDNGTYVLSWDGINNIDNYTLFWCYHNQSKICNGRLDFMVLERNKNKHVIDLPREHKYQFAISANNGTNTSGMIWTKCEY